MSFLEMTSKTADLPHPHSPEPTSPVGQLLAQQLAIPISDLFSRPRKLVRGRLIRIAYEIALKTSDNFYAVIPEVETIIEQIHAGSLIHDDIEDESVIRRGQPTLHLRYGVPTSLNVGSFLYFLALNQISSLQIDPFKQSEILKSAIRAIKNAHEGQALDLATLQNCKNRSDIQQICTESLNKKSGELIGLCFEIGAILAGATLQTKTVFRDFGISLGSFLQKFDDVGNLNTSMPTAKHLEDFRLFRPTYVWQWAAMESEASFQGLCDAWSNLPRLEPLEKWIVSYQFLERCLPNLRLEMQTEIRSFLKSQNIPDSNLAGIELMKIGDTISNAYFEPKT